MNKKQKLGRLNNQMKMLRKHKDMSLNQMQNNQLDKTGRSDPAEAKEAHHQKRLKRSGPNQQVVTLEVHQIGQALTLERLSGRSKLQQLHKHDIPSENYTLDGGTLQLNQ